MDPDSGREGQESTRGGGPPGPPPRWFQELAEKHGPMLLRRAQRFPGVTRDQAEDLVNTLWLYALVKQDVVFRHPNPQAWLLRVLGNRYIDTHCRPTKADPSGSEALARMAVEDQSFARFENHDTLKLALQALPENLAQAVRLRLEGHKLEEIARRQSISVAEAGRRCGRGLQLLSEFIKRNNP
jgi:RNA polymerase sigma factor (sigma-70 family)